MAEGRSRNAVTWSSGRLASTRRRSRGRTTTAGRRSRGRSREVDAIFSRQSVRAYTDQVIDKAKYPDKYQQYRACEVQHRGMGTMEEDCKNAIPKPWK